MTTEVTESSETTPFSYIFNSDYTTESDLDTTTSHGSIVPTKSGENASINYSAAFEAFNILEIAMTSLELMLWIGAAIIMPRWRKNYRNQMLMQISVARFLKRLIFTIQYLEKVHVFATSDTFLKSSQIYIDFVIVILVFFFIKHMYDSLIIVLVKCRQNSLYKISLCAWLLPLPMSATWTAVIVYKALDEKLVYLLICCIFRWPLMLLGTTLYITILVRVLFDKIRKFARSLTVVTFFMCLIVNLYLLTKDVIMLWCIKSDSTTLLGYVLGFVMNFLILTFYIILITLDRKHCDQTSRSKFTHSQDPEYSLTETHNFKI